MYKTIQNENTGVIHIAYNDNHPITHCGSVDTFSEKIYIQRYTTRALRNDAVTCKKCLAMLAARPGKDDAKMKENKEPRPKTPLLSIDAIIEYQRKLVVIERLNPPLGLAWPGGMVDVGETIKNAVMREMVEEVNLKVDVIDFIGIYDNPDRDERGHIVSLAYLCEAVIGVPKAKDDAKAVHLITLDEALKMHLIADHDQMLLDALDLAMFNRRRI